MKQSFLAGCLFVLFGASARAAVGDPTIQTDHPHYPGEGAFQSVEDCVRWATRGRQSNQDKAIALFQWLLTHQFHLASPQEWNVPGKRPDSRKDDQEMIVYDANRARFSYGYGLCGTVHAWNEPYWKALGMNARRRAFPGHTNSEIEYDGAWHAFDTDMAGLVFRKDGVVAGYDDIVKDPTLDRCGSLAAAALSVRLAGRFQRHEGRLAGNRPEEATGTRCTTAATRRSRVSFSCAPARRFTRYFDRDHFGGPSEAPLLAPSGRRAVSRLDLREHGDAGAARRQVEQPRQCQLLQWRVRLSAGVVSPAGADHDYL